MNFVLYFRSMNVKSLIIIVLFYGIQAQASLADFEFKNCDNIQRDSLGDLVLFAYKEDVANLPFGKEFMSKDNKFRDDSKNKYPQVGKINSAKNLPSGERSHSTAFFVKNGDGRRTLRASAHGFINPKTGKLHGPLDKFDFELGGRKYGIESLRCGRDISNNFENLYLDQCEVTLKEDIPEGIEPLELDFDYLKTDPELTHFGKKISPILKPFQNEVAEWDKQINPIQTKLDELEKKIKKYKKTARDSEIVKIQNLLELEKQKKELEIQIKDLKSAREIPLQKIRETYPFAKKFGIVLVGFHGFHQDWKNVRSINHCGYVYDRDLEFDDDIFSAQCNSSAGMSGAPLMHNRRVVGMVVSAGQANVDNSIIPPLPAEQLHIVINRDNEKDFL